MPISFENNPYLQYVVADDEEAARWRMMAATKTAQENVRKSMLYPWGWDLLCARRLAARAIDQFDQFSIVFQEIAGIDLAAGKLLYNDGVVALFGEQRAVDRFKNLNYYLEPLGDEVVTTFDHLLTKDVEARVVGIVPPRLERGFVYHVDQGRVYHWTWGRYPHKSGEVMIACSVSDAGVSTQPGTDPNAVRTKLRQFEDLPLISVTADCWPNHTPTVKGLLRQLLIRSITKNEL